MKTVQNIRLVCALVVLGVALLAAPGAQAAAPGTMFAWGCEGGTNSGQCAVPGGLSDVVAIDARLGTWAMALEAESGRHERETPGAGAAGGVGFALLSLQDRFRSFGLRPGVELVMAATGFDVALAAADVVTTGEGRIDAQTAFGKTAMGVALKARDAGVPCIAVAGGCTPEGIDALTALGVVVVPVSEAPQSIEAAMAAGTEPLVRCGDRLARLVTLGLGLAR